LLIVVFVIVISIIVAPLPPTILACPLLHPPRRFSHRWPPHPTIIASLLLHMLRISRLLLAVGGSAVDAPPPPKLLLVCCCHVICRGAALFTKTNMQKG
jgi:hypothetical protein